MFIFFIIFLKKIKNFIDKIYKIGYNYKQNLFVKMFKDQYFYDSRVLLRSYQDA